MVIEKLFFSPHPESFPIRTLRNLRCSDAGKILEAHFRKETAQSGKTLKRKSGAHIKVSNKQRWVRQKRPVVMKGCQLHASLTSGATKSATLAKTVEVPNG
jgi:hypothetical protein